MLTAVLESPLATVRTATDDDIPAIVALGVAFLQQEPYCQFVTPNVEALTGLFTSLVPLGGVFVSDRDGVVEGMIGLLLHPHPCSGALIANEVVWFVDPAVRGHGLRLLEHAEAWAQAQHATAIHMIAPEARIGRLYARRGYSEVEVLWHKPLGVQ